MVSTVVGMILSGVEVKLYLDAIKFQFGQWTELILIFSLFFVCYIYLLSVSGMQIPRLVTSIPVDQTLSVESFRGPLAIHKPKPINININIQIQRPRQHSRILRSQAQFTRSFLSLLTTSLLLYT